ncbi:MAG TPA: transporter substrate-binding domain-containing protein [Paucimonas sp.]|nr:transporter substrate-binding domain-containing protein [Paucimonas sp.]
MKQFRFLLQCSLLLAAGTAHASPVTVRITAQENLPPKWIAYDNRVEGVCPDILAAIEKIEPRLRFTGQRDARSVPVMEKEVEAGRIDAMCALLDTPRRRQIAQIVGASLYSVRHKLAAAAADPVVVNHVDDLVRLKSLVNTTRGASYVDQLRGLGVEVDDSSGDMAVNLKKVLIGRGRFAYMNELTLAWIIQVEGLQEKIRILPATLKEEPIYFWMGRKVDPATIKMVADALDKLAANGELARIYERWASVKLK